MRALRLISTTAAILLLGACAVAAEGMKTDETPGVPAAQQNAPPEKMAPAEKADQNKAPEATGVTTPETANKQQTMDKEIPRVLQQISSRRRIKRLPRVPRQKCRTAQSAAWT